MAISSHILLALSLLVSLSLLLPTAEAHLDDANLDHLLSNVGLEWPIPSSFYDAASDLDGDDEESESTRRALFWRHSRYYISYGALSANRIPCPPRSGRSYYTHNCFRSRDPAHPYNRGCSMISRCRR